MSSLFLTRFAAASAATLVCAATMAQQPPAAPTATPAAQVAAPTAPSNWREDFAYTLGMHAYIFGMPYGYFQGLRHKYPWVKATPEANARANQFWHQRDFTSPKEKDGGTPNTNLFYSVTSFDVSKEPLILSVPAVTDRYYTHELISMDSDNFAYVGTRATGTQAGHYAIVGPGWVGQLPADVTALAPSRTPFGLIYGRTWVDGPADLPKAYAIQNQYKLTPLSAWGKPGAAATPVTEPWAPYDTKIDPLAEWKTINRSLTENPPGARHAALMGQYARIGVGPGQDVTRMDEATQRGLLRAARDARALVRKAFAQGLGRQINGWGFPPPTVGRAGLSDDYMLRAVTALIGNGINDPEENVYQTRLRDSDGQRLNSAHRYTLRFKAGEFPQVDARGYWSLTMYGMDNDLVANPINRYTFASKPAGAFRLEADGGATFYIQAETPGADKESNWLPAPAGNQMFYMILREYLPGPDILKQTYLAPEVVRVK